MNDTTARPTARWVRVTAPDGETALRLVWTAAVGTQLTGGLDAGRYAPVPAAA